MIDHLAGRVRHHVSAVFALRAGPLPRSAMLRSGLAIDAGFLLLLAFGRPEAAVICAFFTNFLCLADRAEDLRSRVGVQVGGAALFAAMGGLGLAVTGHPVLILAAVFAVALGAGFVHGTVPGLEALPRFALCCLIVAAFLPIGNADTVAAVLVGAPIAAATVILDHRIRHGRRGAHNAQMRAAITYPGPSFSLAYGSAAAVGLAIGLTWGEVRPYWVTLTTLLVMQPDRRANTVRVLQRFVGTLAGVVAAFTLVHAIPDAARPAGIVLLGVLMPFVWPLGFDRNYALGVAILSTWVLLLLDSALPSTDLATPLFLARLSDTAIGCAVALAGSFAVLGSRKEAGG